MREYRREPADRIPHTRGDGPEAPTDATETNVVFPTHVGMDRCWPCSRGWRWSVFPTHMGMDRYWRRNEDARPCIPHTRGDGPRRSLEMVQAYAYSPHTWGWTDRRQCVLLQVSRIPHTRGDGPFYKPRLSEAKLVFPTHVGMDRGASLTTPDPWPYSPHTWGWTELHDQ